MQQENKLDRIKALLSEDKESRGQAAILSRDLLFLATSVIEGTGNSKLSKAVAYGSAAFTVGSALKGFWDLYRKSNEPLTYTIKITEDDQIFDIVEEWFMDALPEEDQRSVFAHSEVTKTPLTTESPRVMSQDDWETQQELEALGVKDRVVIDYSFDGTIVQTLTIAGHEVDVYTSVPESRGAMTAGEGKSNWNSRSMNIVCPSVEARNAVLKEIEAQSQHLVSTRPRMFVSTKWGDFRRRAEIQPRSKESVVLKEGQMDRIIGHLKGFLDNRQAYAKVDIPFRTGILLYGEPGSGKSSTALAIANELRMNVYIIALSSLLNDEALNDCFSNIPPNSIIILEDIDIASAVKDRDDDDTSGVTMSGMLNVLDGFQSPPGVITIMTTNRLDVLDPAIIRPGRVDLQENLDCLDDFQLHGLCKFFMGSVPKNLPHITPDDGITSAQVMGVVRKHLPDFENAGEDMVQFIVNQKAKSLDKVLTNQV